MVPAPVSTAAATANKPLLNGRKNRIIEENAAIAQTVMDKTKNLEALKLDIINSVSELSAISEENAASNEEVTARVTEIAESVNRISEDTQTVRKVSSDMKELMGYFK